VRNPLALLSSQLELLDRAGPQVREESFEALDGVQSSQYTDQSNELGAVAGLDTLEGALADARLLGKLGLSQAGFDAVSLDPLAENVGDCGVGELGSDSHNSY